MTTEIRCRATLHLIATDEGGRKTGIFSGYRGRFQPDVDPTGLQADYFAQTDVLGDSIAPGETGEVSIRIGMPGATPEVWIGLEFSLREGPRVVARGCVTEVEEDVAG